MNFATSGLSLAGFGDIILLPQPFTGSQQSPRSEVQVTEMEGDGPPSAGSMANLQATSATPWGVKLAKNIERLRHLVTGWDGPRSLPIDKSLLNRVHILIRESLTPLGIDARAPFVVPLPNGGIQVEWHTVKGELEFELMANGKAAVWIKDHGTDYEVETEGPKAFNLFLLWAPRLAQEEPDVVNALGPLQATIFAAAA